MGAAFQLKGDRFAADGAYGTSAFGTAPFGGQAWPAYEPPPLQLGSDSLAKRLHRVAAEVVHRRYGRPVASRLHSLGGRWRVVYNATTEAAVEALRDYFDARVFYLLPDGTDAQRVEVLWSGSEFRAVLVAPGHYRLTFDLEELG